jgi:hypothetical protein
MNDAGNSDRPTGIRLGTPDESNRSNRNGNGHG